MHARELVELAAVASSHGPALVAGPSVLSDSGLDQYWVASKCRLERWGRALKSFGQSPSAWATDPTALSHRDIQAVIEEVFASEVLTRVWSAVLVAYDSRRSKNDASILGRSIYLGHLEIRNRVLKLLVSSPQLSAEHAVRLNRLRQRCERWTDILIGHIAVAAEVVQFAPHPDRAAEFALEFGPLERLSVDTVAWRMTLATLRSAFQQGFSTTSANPDSNIRIAASVMASFSPEAFDSSGLFPSLWSNRLLYTTLDTQMLIDEMFSPQLGRMPITKPSASNTSAPPRRRFGADELR